MNDHRNLNTDDLILSRSEVRAIDEAAIRSLRIPGLLLMENAARGVTEQLHHLCRHAQVTIVCGPGNNGGDGLAVARLLAAEGIGSRVLLETAGRSLSEDAQSNLDFLTHCGVSVQVFSGSPDRGEWLSELTPNDWIVDSLLGTGVRGELRAPFRSWVQAINTSPAHVLAVDVPSGMDCDDGTCGDDCIEADRTVTFVGMKRGFLAPSASKYTGSVVVVHIGIPHEWIRQWLQQRRSLGL